MVAHRYEATLNTDGSKPGTFGAKLTHGILTSKLILRLRNNHLLSG